MTTRTTRYLVRLKLRLGKRLATQESSLDASTPDGPVRIASAGGDQPLSEAHWVTLSCRGFGTESDAARFGEHLRRAAHMAGLCSRAGVDAGDPGENRTLSRINPEILESARGPSARRLVPDVHGVVVLPDDGKNLVAETAPAVGVVRANAAGFVAALEEALTTATPAEPAAARIRQAVRVLNLAEMNVDPLAKTVLAVAALEGLAARQRLPAAQQDLVDRAAAWLGGEHAPADHLAAVVQAIRGLKHESVNRSVKRLLSDNGHSGLYGDWGRLYNDRSRVFHNDRGHGGEALSIRLTPSELHGLGQRAVTLCSRIVLCTAKRHRLPVPRAASLHFDV